jgi:hypothetical protein
MRPNHYQVVLPTRASEIIRRPPDRGVRSRSDGCAGNRAQVLSEQATSGASASISSSDPRVAWRPGTPGPALICDITCKTVISSRLPATRATWIVRLTGRTEVFGAAVTHQNAFNGRHGSLTQDRKELLQDLCEKRSCSRDIRMCHPSSPIAEDHIVHSSAR